MLRVALLGFGLGFFLPTAALACGKTELLALIASAQTLAPQSEAQAAKLLNCPTEAAPTMQWLAFYRSVSRTEKNPPVAIRAVVPSLGVSPGLNREISQAYLGSPSLLKAKFESGDPTYREEPQVYLALARALVRQREFAEGRSFYASYLRMVRGAYAEEIEYLYSFIWEGRLDQTQYQLANADLADTPADYGQSIARGKELVQRLRSAAASSGPGGGVRSEAFFGVDLEGYAIKDELQRISSGLRFHGPIDAVWRHHLVKELSYDRATLSADEFRLGAEHTLGNRLTIGAHVGYLTNAEQHYIGDALLRVRIKNQFWLGGGVQRQGQFTTVPLTTTALGLLRDEAYAEAGWPGWLTARSAYLRDHQLAAYEQHQVNLRQPLKSWDNGSEVVGVLGSVFYEARPQPSPDYESYHETFKIGLGAYIEQKLGEDWTAAAEVQYLLAQLQPFGTNMTQRHSGADVKAQLSQRIGDGWSVVGKLAYGVQETDRPSQNIEQRLAVLASLELRR